MLGPRMAISRRGGTALLLALIVVALDQVSKWWVLAVVRLPELGTTHLLGPLSLTMVWNRGVSFGLFWADHAVMRWALVVFSLGVSAALAVWAGRARRGQTTIALGVIMGGALGNVVDRIRLGAVADFIDVSALGFPWIVNVADLAINVGIGLLLLDMVLSDKKAQPARDAA